MVIKSKEGEILNYIDFDMRGVSRAKLIEMFVEKINLFREQKELKSYLQKLKNKGLLISKIIDKETTYFVSDKGKKLLADAGYIGRDLARHERRKQLIAERLDYSEDGLLIESKENVFKYFEISQILFKEFYNKLAPIETIEAKILESYGNARVEDLENDIDVLLKKYSEGLINEEINYAKAFQLHIDIIGVEEVQKQISELIAVILKINYRDFSSKKKRDLAILKDSLIELNYMSFFNDIHKKKLLQAVYERYDSFKELKGNNFLKIFEETD